MDWNLGWNIGLFNDLLTADINLYSKQTSDLFTNDPKDTVHFGLYQPTNGEWRRHEEPRI